MRTSSLGRTPRASRNRLLFVPLAGLAVFLSAPAHAPAVEQASTAPDSLTNAEFWTFFTSMSEEGGYFLSENFVSNEMGFQEVIPTLQKSLTKGGVYLGVGPEQNFTYIANLKPRMAVIFDIRRQNAMHHLMYKALFELSATREEFVARLFSRPRVAHLTPGIPVRELFDSAEVAAPSDSAHSANFTAMIERLVKERGFGLAADDIATIRHVYDVFFRAGPLVNYGYRGGTAFRTTYPTFGMLQAATNADSVEMAFLATEANYQAVRQLQLKNLIVPVVGDFGGQTAIRSVGAWLRDRKMTVTAFYVSNVEQYLFRDSGASDRFYANVSALPHDTTSRFIRSVPGGGGMPMIFSSSGAIRSSIAPGVSRVEIVRDASGTTTRTFRDSAGVTVVQTTRDTIRFDSAAMRIQAARDSILLHAVRSYAGNDTALMRELRSMNARRDSVNGGTWQILSGPPTMVRGIGLLTSGLASIDATLKAFFLGDLKGYNNVVDMTKISGWK